jgi:hypothetical protein
VLAAGELHQHYYLGMYIPAMFTSESRFPSGDHSNPFPNPVVSEAIRFLNASEMYKDEIIPAKKDAAVVAEINFSTSKHRTCGRRSTTEYGMT